jgi:Prophage antirepressor
MRNDLKIFEFENKTVECIFLDYEPLFNPYDVGNCLKMSESTVKFHLADMDEDEKIILENSKVSLTNFRKLANRGETFIKEPGLYQLIFKSRKPEAQKFVKWITHEVLPSIRKTGSYQLPENRLIKDLLETTEQLIGIKKEELAILQQESWNKKLSNLMVDCSINKMGSMNDLYDEMYYVFASETGIDIPEIAELKGLKTMDYLRKNPNVAKTVYEFAMEHFNRPNRQIMLIPTQSMLTDFK